MIHRFAPNVWNTCGRQDVQTKMLRANEVFAKEFPNLFQSHLVISQPS
jgi:hypothetical protein